MKMYTKLTIYIPMLSMSGNNICQSESITGQIKCDQKCHGYERMQFTDTDIQIRVIFPFLCSKIRTYSQAILIVSLKMVQTLGSYL